MNYNYKEAEFEIERLQSRVNHLTVTNHNVRQKNKELIESLELARHMLWAAKVNMHGDMTHTAFEIAVRTTKTDIEQLDRIIKQAKGE